MNNLLNLIGPQIYGNPRPGSKKVSINIDLDQIHSKVFNFTGYSWVDQKFKFATNLLFNCLHNKIIIHDSDYLGLEEYAEHLKERNHEVVFVLSPSEDWTKSGHPLSQRPASNQRIRAAHDRLKEAGVKVKKFKSMDALEKYLIRKGV